MIVETEDNYFKDKCMSCYANSDSFDGAYYAVNKLNFALFDHNWTALDELLMFEGLETQGFGNWSDIAQYIGGGKTRDEVEEHYQKYYLSSHDFLPSSDILSHRNEDGVIWSETNVFQARLETRAAMKGSLQVAQPGPVVNQNKQSSTPAQIVGFMPRRGDFEIEYDNDAQLLLAQMQFNDDDTTEQKEMKFRLMDIYNHKLDERIKRKEFVISRKLLDIREQMRLDKIRTREEKEIYNLMKVVARFNTPEDHEKLVQGIIREKQLRQRIAELKELQTKGLRTWGEVEDELEAKKKKDDRKKREDNYPMDKSKTRRVARKDTTTERSQKRVFYITPEQEQLCSRLSMTFRQFSAIKEKIMRQAVRVGLLNRDEVTQSIQMNKRVVESVFDFLVEQEEVMLKRREAPPQDH